MWINKRTITGLILLLFLSACSSKRLVSTPAGTMKELSRNEKKELLSGIESSELLYNTFSTKARTQLSVDNKNFNATLNIRIKHNEVIWISANVFLGIEAARIMITPDRIQIINRLQGTYVDKPFDYIYNFTSKELSFEELEQLFVGNSISFYNDPLNTVVGMNNQFKISGGLEDLTFEMDLGADYNLMQTKLSESNKSQTLQFSYPDYANIQSQVVPSTVNINLKAPTMNIDAAMKYEDTSLDQDLSFPFTVPERYKKI
ncbi:DUF4292 domain-containing protein [Albibacterium bauzanense]|uniref:Uncharacterized protein DUF4292 n=1 Tax=Albibacterium bauzanense TaxID=653929 RepID=A0A4R1LX48_9SPHI|nr:DUF4292 domain-containing protein [Albibacterium bauzanense]TCK83054.1 uncharacterized protein DUF4292 [Albibacterium bauzanense]